MLRINHFLLKNSALGQRLEWCIRSRGTGITMPSYFLGVREATTIH